MFSVDPNQIADGNKKHKSLPDELVSRIANFKRLLGDVEPTPLDSTIENFCYDQNPDREIAIWEAMAEIYAEYIANHPSLTHDEKRVVFGKILGASTETDPITVSELKDNIKKSIS